MQFSILPEPDRPHAALLFSSSAGCCDSASCSTLSSCLSAVGSEGVGDVLCGRWAVIMPASGLMSSLERGFGHSDPFCLIGSRKLQEEVPFTSGSICRFKCSFICIGIVQGDLYGGMILNKLHPNPHYALYTLASSIFLTERKYKPFHSRSRMTSNSERVK